MMCGNKSSYQAQDLPWNWVSMQCIICSNCFRGLGKNIKLKIKSKTIMQINRLQWVCCKSMASHDQATVHQEQFLLLNNNKIFLHPYCANCDGFSVTSSEPEIWQACWAQKTTCVCNSFQGWNLLLEKTNQRQTRHYFRVAVSIFCCRVSI